MWFHHKDVCWFWFHLDTRMILRMPGSRKRTTLKTQNRNELDCDKVNRENIRGTSKKSERGKSNWHLNLSQQIIVDIHSKREASHLCDCQQNVFPQLLPFLFVSATGEKQILSYKKLQDHKKIDKCRRSACTNTHLCTHNCTDIYRPPPLFFSHTHIHTHPCTYTHTHAHTHTLMHTHTHSHTHACTHMHTHTHTHTRIHTHTHTHTHTHSSMHTPSCIRHWPFCNVVHEARMQKVH